MNGFIAESTTFINWELVTKKGNTAIRDSERKNLYDRIADAHRNGIEFIVIIDAFAAKNIIRVSATAIENKRHEFIEVDELDVINAGLITKALYVNDGIPVFLLMKQAISTGWDCPRAKILVKLRENMSESFEIQTIGRIRRMPEAIHYEDDLLDFCYIYTFDEKYKAGLLANIDKAYEIRRLFLKDKCKTFTLEKQIRDLDFEGLGEREVLNKIYDSLVRKYKLGVDKKQNKMLFEQYCEDRDDIDRQIENKFNAFKDYAKAKGIQWGFVRDKDSRFYINNTEFAKSMSDEHWVAFENVF